MHKSFCSPIAVFVFIVGSIVGSIAAQTKLSVQQVELPPDQIATVEERWCPQPALFVSTARTEVTIGKNWSITKPCYLHFNVTPPAKLDPIAPFSLVEPAIVSIGPGFVGDDDAFVFVTAPKFEPAVPAKLQISVKTAGAVVCTGCTGGVTTDLAAVRTFPPDSVPIGFLRIRGGLFAPKPDDILTRQQVYIGPGTAMQIVPDQGGYWFRVDAASSAAATIQTEQVRLAAAQAEAVQETIRRMPVGEQRIAELSKTVKELTDRVQQLPPTPEQVQDLLAQILEQLRSEAEMIAQQARESKESLSEVLHTAADKVRVSPPMNRKAPCSGNLWAMDDKHLYQCIGKVWVRIKLDKWKE